MGRRFDDDYKETVTLRGGRRVVLRLVQPNDKPLLAEGLHRMSAEGRYRRFFSPRSELSDKELRYLTEIDQINHVAIGAVEETDDGQRGLGVARFVRLADEADVAEAAIAVVDDAQRLGLGRLLFSRLIAAARERGIAFFRSDVLSTNEQMLAFVSTLGDGSVDAVEDGVVTLTLPLPKPDDAAHTEDSALYRLLRLAAERMVFIQRFLSWLEAQR